MHANHPISSLSRQLCSNHQINVTFVNIHVHYQNQLLRGWHAGWYPNPHLGATCPTLGWGGWVTTVVELTLFLQLIEKLSTKLSIAVEINDLATTNST